MVQLNVILTKEEDMYIAKCPEVGTVSQGHTIEESLENLKEATELYLEEFPLKGIIQRSLLTTIEIQNASA
jgi:predicted RNase H-like HicB family nuclease